MCVPPADAGTTQWLTPADSAPSNPAGEGWRHAKVGKKMWGPRGPAIDASLQGLLLGPASGNGEAYCLPRATINGPTLMREARANPSSLLSLNSSPDPD
ncbi:hypothetical protein C0993_007113 [Termitomyces sp. T159_Od127]|nr:hypothetical protein C0993_007113 [Termitomyces sp. T159_Od127]